MKWYKIKQSEELSSPALVVYPERIEHNIQEMLHIAGSADRLWPHVKTHKMSAIIALQKKQGHVSLRFLDLFQAYRHDYPRRQFYPYPFQ